MKNIEEINRENVKKISAEKKLPDFFPGDIIKVGVRIQKEREKEFNISRAFVSQKKIETLTLHLP